MTTTRREFITQGAAATLAASSAAYGYPANDSFTVGVIGPGGMGSAHLGALVTRKDARVAAVCDPDKQRLDRAAQTVEKAGGKAPMAVTDIRKVLDDKSIDVVFIATPDHWHAPATILACDAGKHVYVEKPCSHNIREGRLMTEAARRNKKVVQVGTQSRSNPEIIRAIQLLREGAIGEVIATKAWNSQLRRSIGKTQPSDPPAGLDFDLWLGPAPKVPYRSNMLPGIWRWWHAFGAGDIGNDGVHDIDVARWGLGVDTHPTRVTALGGKYFFDDDQEWPDTQYAVFEYELEGGKKKQFTYEQRIWSPYHQEEAENGCAWYGTKGMMLMGHTSHWRIIGAGNKPGERVQIKLSLSAHHDNFFDCIRNSGRPNADVEIGHLSAAIVHLANISTRLGRTLKFDPVAERFPGDEEANRLVRREYREGHWAVPKGV
jgi:predicted dehydrogenase